MEIRNQSMPSYQDRLFNQNDSNELLHSVIDNLRYIIKKKDVEIERLRSQLNEEKTRKYTFIGT